MEKYKKERKTEEIAFEKFEVIDNLSSLYEKKKEWLKDYEGNHYSIAEDGKHKMKWQSQPQEYDSNKHNNEINVIKELPYRLRIEFDDKDEKGEKDKEKIKENIEKTKKILLFSCQFSSPAVQP